MCALHARALLAAFPLLVIVAEACAPPPAPAAAPAAAKADDEAGGRDAAGHPVGARVLEAEGACNAAVGQASGADAWSALPERDAAGSLCRGTLTGLGRGELIVNVRASSPAVHPCRFSSWPASQPCPEPAREVLTIEIFDDDSGALVATKTVTELDFWRPWSYEDLSLRITRRADWPLRVELRWAGAQAVRLDYVEVFRPDQALALDPPSGLVDLADDAATLLLQLEDPANGRDFSVRCGDRERTATLATLLAAERASDERTPFRRVIKAPLAALLAGCTFPARLAVSAGGGGEPQVTRRVTYLDRPLPCDFVDDGANADGPRARVLLTGFEPFPASSATGNVSAEAVQALSHADLDAPLRDRVALMKLVLPVEWDSAADWVVDVIDRCRPQAVISFGQGGSGVSLELTAYNLKDASTRAWQADNRGVMFASAPIVADGPSTHGTGLPAEAILAALHAAGIAARTSTDPGRYICNNLFYRTVHRAVADGIAAGFVHLGADHDVTESDRAALARALGIIVSQTVATLRPASAD